MAAKSLKVTESEQELVSIAQSAVSQCNWVVGECAAKWTQKYAKGRTDADFAEKVGLSSDQVYQRRRVWEAFGSTREEYAALKWSHYYVALNWDDSSDCLEWAQENDATVAEMKAWRRAVRGEDLSSQPPPDEFGGDPAILRIPSEPTAVRDVSEAASNASRSPRAPGERTTEAEERLAGVARQSEPSNGDEARSASGATASGRGSSTAIAEDPRAVAEQNLKRMTAALERMNKGFSADAVREMRKLPEKLRDRFVKAVGELNSKASQLMS